MVYGITSKYGATRWSTSDINMCGRQKDMLAFVGMGYKGVDCIYQLGTLSEIPKFSRVFANSSANTTPVCDYKHFNFQTTNGYVYTYPWDLNNIERQY